MSRILIIVSDWQGGMIWPGGVAAYMDSLTRALMDAGEEVKLLAVVRPYEVSRKPFLEIYQQWAITFPVNYEKKPANWLGRKIVSALEILRCSSPRWRRWLASAPFFESSADSIKRLERVLSEGKPDAVIIGYLDVWLYPLSLCLQDHKVPYVVIAHDSEISHGPDSRRNDIALRRAVLAGASWIAANSEHTKSLLKVWKIPADRVKIVYPPISQDSIDQSAKSDAPEKTSDRLNIVSICRLVRGKGIDLVIRALKILDDKGIPYRYFVAGDGAERESLESMADALNMRDKVHFMGSVHGEDKWRLLRMGDVFVTPSRTDPSIPWQEGFGIAFVEAAAFGLPAVASKSGGIPEAVVHGETGLLVPEEAYVELADALMLLCKNPEMRKSMGKAARERARELFSPKAIANRFREEISKAAHP